MLQREAPCGRNHKHCGPQPQRCLILTNQCEKSAILNLWHLYWEGVLWPVTQHNSIRESENANRRVKIKMPGVAWQQWWASFCPLGYPVTTHSCSISIPGSFHQRSRVGKPPRQEGTGNNRQGCFHSEFLLLLLLYLKKKCSFQLNTYIHITPTERPYISVFLAALKRTNPKSVYTSPILLQYLKFL